MDKTDFAGELESLLNRHSMENASDTPDFILAHYLLACLLAWNTGVQQRETWYGRGSRPASQVPINQPPAGACGRTPGGAMKFRKKPVVIDAFEWTGDFDALDVWLNVLGYSEDGESLDGGADGIHESETEDNVLVIPTEEGEHRAQSGDWIIRGVRGEFYPCKPDIFAVTYEKVDD